jgi:hypothetical protein
MASTRLRAPTATTRPPTFSCWPEQVEARLGVIEDTPYVIATNATAGGQAFAPTPSLVNFVGTVTASGSAWSGPSNFVATRAGLFSASLTLNFSDTATPPTASGDWCRVTLTHRLSGGATAETRVFDGASFHGVFVAARLKLAAGDFVNWTVECPTGARTTYAGFGQAAELVFIGTAAA